MFHPFKASEMLQLYVFALPWIRLWHGWFFPGKIREHFFGFTAWYSALQIHVLSKPHPSFYQLILRPTLYTLFFLFHLLHPIFTSLSYVSEQLLELWRQLVFLFWRFCDQVVANNFHCFSQNIEVLSCRSYAHRDFHFLTSFVSRAPPQFPSLILQSISYHRPGPCTLPSLSLCSQCQCTFTLRHQGPLYISPSTGTSSYRELDLIQRQVWIQEFLFYFSKLLSPSLMNRDLHWFT